MKPPGVSRRPRLLLFSGILLTILGGVLSIFPTQFLLFLDSKFLDTLVRAGQHPAPSGRVVMVNVDEVSLSRHGQWPWPRHRLAALSDRLTRLKPKAVAIDFTFPEPDRTSLSVLREEIGRNFGIALSLKGLPPSAVDNDLAFALALSRGPFVLGYQFTFAPDEPVSPVCGLHPVAVRFEGAGPARGFFEADGAVCSVSALAGAVESSGFLNASPDTDGILRRIPTIIGYRGNLYPSFALAAAMKATGQSIVTVHTGPSGIESLGLGGRKIPLDERGHLSVQYRGPRNTIPSVSAADVLEGKIPADRIEGKLVVVGTPGMGILDLRSTPLDVSQPGTEIQATAMDNLLVGDPLSRPSWGHAVTLLLVLLAGGLATWICIRSRPLWSLGLLLFSSLVFSYGSAQVLWRSKVYVSPVLPTAALWIIFVALIALRTFLAERQVKAHLERLLHTQDALIQSMSEMAERRHAGTGGHIQRTRHYVQALARHLRKNPRFSEALDDATIDLLFRLAPLHDIGKVGIPDHILMKADRLSPEEFEIMKKHTVYGSETIRHAQEILGEESFLTFADEFALSHQEKWNGTGYPKGLRGTEIPLAARLMAVADVYDALVSEREYKRGMPHEEAVSCIAKERGASFDPDIADAFAEIHEQFAAIARHHAPRERAPEAPVPRGALTSAAGDLLPGGAESPKE